MVASQRPGRQAMRTKIAKRICVRISPTSQSLRSILNVLCMDQAVPLEQVKQLDLTIVGEVEDAKNWQSVVAVVGQSRLHEALLSICKQGFVGPVAAFSSAVVAQLGVHLYEQQEMATAASWANETAVREHQLKMQEKLTQFVDDELTTTHEAHVAACAST